MKYGREDYNSATRREILIPEKEPVFLLRAKDRTAATAVRFWANLQKNEKIREEAHKQADLMDAWPKKKEADLPE